MRKLLLLTFILIIFCSGCSGAGVTNAQEPNVNNGSEPQSRVEDVKADLSKSTDAAATSKTYESKTDKLEKIDVPQKYIDFVKKKGELDADRTIVFYTREDLDKDGETEIVLASGIPGDDSNPPDIYGIYILREENGKVVQLGEDIETGGYSVYNVKLISLQNLPKKFIYLGLTNWGGLSGFQIVELIDNEPKIICYSASATGAGEDVLQDFDNDGSYDGFTQNRWSYEVLYFSTIRTYILKDGGFVWRDATVEVPAYPDNIKDVITQYLSLVMISDEGAPEVTKRLSELCTDKETKQDYFKNDIWYNAVYNTVMEVDEMIEFNINENSNSADATIVYEDDDNKQYKNTFHLIKNDNRWVIDKLS